MRQGQSSRTKLIGTKKKKKLLLSSILIPTNMHTRIENPHHLTQLQTEILKFKLCQFKTKATILNWGGIIAT